jgi:hypothetical protein
MTWLLNPFYIYYNTEHKYRCTFDINNPCFQCDLMQNLAVTNIMGSCDNI